MIQLSFISSQYDNQPIMDTFADFEEVEALYREFAQDIIPASDKGKCQLVSPAMYDVGVTRANEHVIKIAPMAFLDVDDTSLTPDQLTSYCDGLNVPYLFHTSASHMTAGKPKYRVLISLDREIEPSEYARFRQGIVLLLAKLKIDPQTKDISRSYFVPANFDGKAIFHSDLSGEPISVDDCIAITPEPEPVVIVPYDPKTAKRVAKAIHGEGKQITSDIQSSPVVRDQFINDYLALPKGEHHVGLFKFMYQIASYALFMGYTITSTDLANYARQVDAICFVKTNPERLKNKIKTEAQRALDDATKRASLRQ